LYRVDAAIKTGDFAALESLVYLPSLIDFYLVQEWFKEIDVSDRSIFMQIKGEGAARRLHFGPVWDFDRSAGNLAFWYTPPYIFAAWRNSWFSDLLEMPETHALIAARWQEMRAYHIPQMLHYAQYLMENYGAAFERNFTEAHTHILGGEPEWNIFTPPPMREITTFRGQVEYLISWLEARGMWLDRYFAGEIRW
jgi:hypothetical protein